MRLDDGEASGGPEPGASAEDPGTLTGGPVLLRRTAAAFVRGDVLAGRYQIERLVGTGATGSVLQAFDRVVRGVVAIKVLRSEFAADLRRVERLGDELRHARRLQHPNVCRLFDLAEADGHHFLTMEYAGGGSLRRRLRETGTTRPLPDRVADARAIIAGLAAIHAAGIIHRDVKPENVLCMEDGRLVLSDFGLAIAPDQTHLDRIAGTPSYMAPEVVIGDKATAASDVWSLGVVLHEVLFGKRPHWELTPRGKVLRSPATRESSRLERDLAQLCGDCLAERPQDRLANAMAVEERLSRILEGRGGRAWRRVRGLAWAGALATLTAIALGASLTRRAPATLPAASKEGVLPLAGKAADWSSRSRVVFSSDKIVSCLDALPDRRTLRFAVGLPHEVFDLDVNSGVVKPADILPRAYAAECPQRSPDGRSLLFVEREPGASAQIMLSEHPDGREARRVTEGTMPRWLSSGREFVYSFDQRRAAIFSLIGERQLFPDEPPLHKVMLASAVRPDGRQVAFLFSDNPTQSIVEIYDLPTRAMVERMRLASPARNLWFDSGTSQLRFAAQDPLFTVVAERRGSKLERFGSLPDLNLMQTVSMGASLAVLAGGGNASLLLGDREIARDGKYFMPTASRSGHVAVQMSLANGRNVIGLRRSDATSLRAITAGPQDAFPWFTDSGQHLFYSDMAQKALVRCEVASLRCSVLFRDAVPIAKFSANDRWVAYFTTFDPIARLKVRSLDGTEVLDLGAFASRCEPHWDVDDKHVWIHSDSPAPLRWVQIDTNSGRATGRTHPAAAGCRESTPPGIRVFRHNLRIERRQRYEIRTVDL